MLQAGVEGVANTAGAVQTLAGPVVNSVSQSAGRFLGTGGSSNGKPDGAAATVRWQSGRRVHLDLDPLLPFPRWHEHAAIVEEPVRKIPGVATAHVEGSLRPTVNSNPLVGETVNLKNGDVIELAGTQMQFVQAA